MLELILFSFSGTFFGILIGFGFYFGGVLGDYIHKRVKEWH